MVTCDFLKTNFKLIQIKFKFVIFTKKARHVIKYYNNKTRFLK